MMTIYEFIPIVTSLSNALIILADYETNGKYRSAQITDCTHTAESIYVLFNPETVDNVTLSSIDEYNTSGIEFDNYNIFMITIQMSGEFHKFGMSPNRTSGLYFNVIQWKILSAFCYGGQYSKFCQNTFNW